MLSPNTHRTRRWLLLAPALFAPADIVFAQTTPALPPVTVDAPKPRPAPRAVRSAAKPVPPAPVVRAAPKPEPRPAARPVRSARRGPPRVITAPPQSPVIADVPGPPIAAPPAEPGRADLSPAPSALPAATTTLSAPQIARLPVNSYGDLFRSLPGFNVSDYGQGAIGYGLSLRGYTEAEHGRDIAVSIDGVPVNDVSSIHTPNYVDLNILIPETIARIDVVRGPFSVEYGDSNLGGSIAITTKTAEPFGTSSVSGGSYGTIRGVGTASTTAGNILPFAAAEGFHTDGYRTNSFVNRYNAFNKVTVRLPDDATLSFRVQAYGTDFGAPGYISRDDVRAGLTSPRAATNITDGGNKQYETFVTTYASGVPDQELSATAYVTHDIFNRYADFGSGQRLQNDTRTTVGGRIRKVTTFDFAGALPTQLLVGASWRSNFIDAFQAPTFDRTLNGLPAVSLGVAQHNFGAYAQVQVKPTDWLKLTAGGRIDAFSYGLNNRLDPFNQPHIAPTVLSPKAGVALTPLPWLELFANYGQGFRSPDAPLELLQNAQVKPFKIASIEGGAQITIDRFRLMGTYWTTTSQNESYQAAPGLPVTFLGRARREGFDLDGRFTVYREMGDEISLFANATIVSARLLDAAPSYFVPNVPRYVVNAGIDGSIGTGNGERLSGTAYMTFVGRKYLTQDGAITTSPFSRLTAKLAYTWPEGITAFGQATWYPGDRLSEIAINFGDPTNAKSSDIYTSPQPALVLKGGLQFTIPTTPVAVLASR